MSTELTLEPKVGAALKLWHNMIETGDLSALPTIVAPDAQFRSPTGFKPYQSADAVVLILNTVIQVFENFEYHRQFAGANGRQVVLEFSANIGDKSLKGIDMVEFDEDGKIVDFEVMVRPASGLAALAAEMGKRLGQTLPTYKA